MKMKKIIDLII